MKVSSFETLIFSREYYFVIVRFIVLLNMCTWEESLLWLVCGGKYKLLLRSAWIVISISTLVDISAITAYWNLAPKVENSKPGSKLSLLLLIAVLFLYFFACFICGFVILKLAGKRYESQSESITFNSNWSRYRPAARFTLPPQTPNSYSNGFHGVLPNNAPVPIPSENSQRTNTTAEQSRRTDNGDNTARSNTRNSKFYTSPRNLNLCDKHDKRQNNQFSMVVPEITLTGPENSLPNYAIKMPQTSQFSTRGQSNSCTNVAYQYTATNPTQNYYRAPGMNSSSVARSNLKRCQTYQPTVFPRSADLTAKPSCSRSESYVCRPVSAIDAKRALELSMNQARMNSRMVNSNPSIGPGVSCHQISTTANPEQYKRRSITITRSSDSFLAKSEPVRTPYRKCIVDKLPASANAQTLMLFKAITRSDHLFESQSNNQAASNTPATNRISTEVMKV